MAASLQRRTPAQQPGIPAAGSGDDCDAELAARLRYAPPAGQLGRESLNALTFNMGQSAGAGQETEKVSEAVRAARNSGLGVVIIDHNIGQVHRICDRIVIMEVGRVIRSVRRDEISAQQVADMVAGKHAL